MRPLAITAALLTACSSNYMPQSRNRVSVMIKDGTIAYIRDGRSHEHGLFGGGLVDAVQGNPAAVSAAHEYRDRLIGGFIGMMGGLACMIGGTGYAAAQIGNDDGEDAAQRGLLVALGCSIVTIVAAGYMASAEPYRWDAINMFNDAPAPGPMFMPGPPGPPTSQRPKPRSLGMRDE